jgi:hypothetical protein
MLHCVRAFGFWLVDINAPHLIIVRLNRDLSETAAPGAKKGRIGHKKSRTCSLRAGSHFAESFGDQGGQSIHRPGGIRPLSQQFHL